MKNSIKTITYDPLPGTYIDTACTQASKFAIDKNCHVKFNFNGVEITATPKSTWDELAAQYHEATRIEHEKYLASPECKAEEIRRTKERNEHQHEIDKLMALLDTHTDGRYYMKNMDFLMTWINSLTEHADYVGVKFDPKKVFNWFKKNKFIMGFGVGEGEDFFQNKENMARYIIGQVMDFLDKGYPPHPVTTKFIGNYFKLKN